jgi:hypothetical protein
MVYPIETLLHEESRFHAPERAGKPQSGTRLRAAPAELEFVAKLPKTRSGKIMRSVLKTQELGLDPGDVSTIEE